MTEAQRQHRVRVALAFGLVYVFWGSTYLGIRIAVEHITPALVTGTRFLIAGPLMLAWCAWNGRNIRVRRSDLLRLGVVGLLLLTSGNMLLAWAEQWVPSGLSALIVAVVPIWVTVLEAGLFHGERLRARGLAGLVLGLAGLAVLLWPDLRHTGGIGRPELVGALLLLVCSLSWALGSVLSRRWNLPVDIFVATGWEMTIAGAVNMAFGSAIGDWGHTTWSWRGLGAILYLVVFGSWVGYSAYIWLLSHVPTAKVATYAYINPVVAVFLGWMVLGEAVTAYILAGTAIIIASVALVNSSKIKSKPAEAPEPAPEEMPAYEPGAD